VATEPLFSGGVLHGRVDAVDGDGTDAVLRVGEVGADLEGGTVTIVIHDND